MRTIVRNSIILLFVLGLALWSIIPPEKRLRLGKDLAGGASLIYAVDIKPGDQGDTLSKVIEVIKNRLDPTGSLELAIVGQGSDRIEITMPLPTANVKRLRAAFDEVLKSLPSATLSLDELERIALMPAAERNRSLAEKAGGDAERLAFLEQAVRDFDALAAARKALADARTAVQSTKDKIRNLASPAADDPILTGLNAALAAAEQAEQDAVRSVAALEISYEASRGKALAVGLNAADLVRALSLSDKPVKLTGKDGKVVQLDSPRARELKQIEERFPQQKPLIAKAIEAWSNYQGERKTLDDPQDIVRILRGAGVLNFRITVNPGEWSGEADAREQLRKAGPKAARGQDVGWFKVNKIESWVDTVDGLEALRKSPAAFFAGRGLIAEEYKGEYYVLAWDRRGLRLTEDDGTWSVSRAFPGADQLGRPAIDFQMDALGADKLGELTGKNVGKNMAVILDDEIYTAPRLQSRISSSGQITGSFPQSEIEYIVRVLGAGSLAAKLSKEPVSIHSVGPELGADNLRASFITGIIAFAAVAAFMVVYYFGCGMIAVVALVVNFILVLAMMAVNHTAFSIPAIAGIILTFGQAVDSNVLVYERMREEFHHGHDLRTSVRLGFSRALPPIVDGNVSNLIICVVLGFLGTQEIRGFAITLGIGVATTLFSTLFVSRLIFNIFIEVFGWRKASQLPMAVPFVQRLLSPHVDWMKHRWTFLGALAVLLAASAVVIYMRGADLLGMEFRGGTAVTLVFKQTPGPDGRLVQTKLKRAEVEQRIKAMAGAAPAGSPLRMLEEKKAQVIAVNPDADNVTSSTFTIKSLITDATTIQSGLSLAFADVLDTRPPSKFTGSDQISGAHAPTFPITSSVLGQSIDRPEVRTPTGEFYGGLAIVIDHLDPPPSLLDITSRIRQARERSSFAEAASHLERVVVIDGTDAAVKSAVVMIVDPARSYGDDPKAWESTLRDPEWNLVRTALSEAQTLGSVQSFSPAIARTFMSQGIICTLVSLLLLTIYVFIRFGTIRWAVAATVPLFADVIGIVGLLGVAQMLYESPATHNFARAIGILPFDFDLTQIAAVLTIVGYSLNDKIIILDRIRENKGRLPYASYQVVNDSINQTLSRTVITGGAHMITTIVLYIFGGEAVRGFAYTFNLGVILGTYTSIVSTPLVWSHKYDPSVNPGAPGSSNGQAGTGSSASSNGVHGSGRGAPAGGRA